ncbi:MAG: hypothetical protein FWE59_05855, partial [Oscillospiraceae bacterium]|nr:hypothetical protein [Oscillospiraceae bacterium]
MNESNNEQKKGPRKSYMVPLLALAAVFFLIQILPSMLSSNQLEEKSYTEFLSLLGENAIKEVYRSESCYVVTPKDPEKPKFAVGFVGDPDLIERILPSDAKYTGEISQSMSPLLESILMMVIS